MKRLWILTALLLAPAFAQAASVAEIAAAKSPAFGAALQSAGFGPMLKGAGPFTLLVPSDAAFAKLGAKLHDDPEKLKAVMAMHIVPGKVTSTEMKERKSAKTVNGSALKVSDEEGKLKIGKATVLQADIAASNGLVDTIDSVLMP